MITQHFSLQEFQRSRAAEYLHIDNTIPEACKPRIAALCRQVLEPLRQHVGVPVRISSGYRCHRLNDIVGGSETSQHMQGEAADIILPQGLTFVPTKGLKEGELDPAHPLVQWFVWLAEHTHFDQLILEAPGDKPRWIHVSHRVGRNRHQVMIRSTVNSQ